MTTAVKDTVVRLKVLGGTWETVGVDRLRGIVAEVDKLDADEWGPSVASFQLHRDPGMMWPDIGAFSDVEIDVGGVGVWDGRISESPTADGDDPVVSVQCEGWRAHLDDDTYRRLYLSTRLTEFKDSRSIPTVDLNLYRSAGDVSNERGLKFGWGAGDNIANNTKVGATFDAGPGQTISQIVYEVTYSNGHTGTMEFWITGTVSSSAPTAGDVFTAATTSILTGTGSVAALNAVTLSTPCRYIHVFMKNVAGDTTSAGGEVYGLLRSILLIADSTYKDSGGASILSAPIIVRDALNRATILLSADRTGIDPTGAATFKFPEFNIDGQKSPREVIDAANSAMNWRSKVAVGRRMIYEPKPAAAAIEVGEWPGCEFADSSANAGADIYNRVIVEGTGPDKEPLSIERSASQQPGVTFDALSTPAPSNPSFDANTVSWTPSSPSIITRIITAGLFDTAPAGGKWDRTGNPTEIGDTLSETFTGTFQAGITYLLRVAATYQGPIQGQPILNVTFGTATDQSRATWTLGTSFGTQTIGWTPAIAASGVTLKLTATSRASSWLIDSLVLSAAAPTLVDRRGFRRTHVLPVKSALTNALATQIADVWLAAHQSTPLKGTVKVTGDGAARHILTGQPVPPEQLLLRTGDMIRLSHRVDPDTGGQGRDGRIVQVSYDPSTDTATVAIDSSRTSVDALLERLALVVGTTA